MKSGYTLLEMLVVMLVLSILANMALPYAELTITRTNEYELQSALRQIRSSIDHFHEDWLAGQISELSRSASADGYPVSLATLVNGVPLKDGGVRHYLRRIPKNPFTDQPSSFEEQWEVRGYQDELKAVIWNGQDVFDVRARTDKTALNGTMYRDW
jgi:general secretion pathway protein G